MGLLVTFFMHILRSLHLILHHPDCVHSPYHLLVDDSLHKFYLPHCTHPIKCVPLCPSRSSRIFLELAPSCGAAPKHLCGHSSGVETPLTTTLSCPEFAQHSSAGWCFRCHLLYLELSVPISSHVLCTHLPYFLSWS